ncbi:MAG TPA: AAA family ATPase, partial [Syntrophomonas sp.]|nr:AAA family ATPase [Syntrophomonas sp.]
EGIDWVMACSKGVQLARKLHILGYEVTEENQYKQLRFPLSSIAHFYHEIGASCNITDRLQSDQISDLGFFSILNHRIINSEDGDHWTILEEKLLKSQQRNLSIQDLQLAVYECARNIVLKGPLSALPDVPVETIGSWSSADRQEIEGVRSVKNAMQDYLNLKIPDTPLCVAVFGPPGAGKSFVVKEIAKGLGIDKSAQLTFNLSQFESPDELQSAFHQIRDLNLQGKMPLVFWDEFDNPCSGRYLGWLRYFLAPMQDGEFTDHGTSRPLGGGIFVFAGATRYSFADFQRGDNDDDRAAKKPDFISRLSAFINIRGINGNPNTVEDRLYMIRRAFILRQYLTIYAPQIRNEQQFVIETGVLDALLKTNKYYHGARSMDNLLKMSNLADKRKFELSSLPPNDIIGMHVNVKEFNALTTMGDRNTLRIGITGYHNLNPEQIGTIEQGIDEAIRFIEEQYADHYLTVFSSLAAGADRLAARHLLNREAARLIAILPLPVEDYINDFGPTDDFRIDGQGAELRKEFNYWLSRKAIETITMPVSPTRKAAYLKAGYFVADNSDIIIAIWNGNEQGGDSITDQIVARAELLNKPICHIWADDFEIPNIRNSVADKCGFIRYKNFTCHTADQWNQS